MYSIIHNKSPLTFLHKYPPRKFQVYFYIKFTYKIRCFLVDKYFFKQKKDMFRKIIISKICLLSICLHYSRHFSKCIMQKLISSITHDVHIIFMPKILERFPPMPAPSAKNNIIPK